MVRRGLGGAAAILVHLLVALILLLPGLFGGGPSGIGQGSGARLSVFPLQPSGSRAAGSHHDADAGAGPLGDAAAAGHDPKSSVKAEAGGGADAGSGRGRGGDASLTEAIAGAVRDDPLGGDDWYRALLRQHLAQHRHAPGAGGGPRSGTVVVRFTLSREGRVIDARVVASRGSSLDQAALSTLWDAEPMPPVPSSLPAPIEVDLPVDFVARG